MNGPTTKKIEHLVLNSESREKGGRSIKPNKYQEKIEYSDFAYTFPPVFQLGQLGDMSVLVTMTTKFSSSRKVFLSSFYKTIYK